MIALTKIYDTQDVFFLLLTTSFLLISILRGLYWRHAKLFFMGVFAQRYVSQYLREENVFTERVNFITFLLLSINITLLISKIRNMLDLKNIIICFILVISFFLIKIIVVNFLGIIFKSTDLTKLAIFFSLLFDKSFALLLYPLVLFLYFFSFDIISLLLFVSSFLFLFCFILKLYWLWKIGTVTFGVSRVYIFLYLCFLEISPTLILVKEFVIK